MGQRQSTTEDGEPQLSYWQMIKLGYAELVNAIIRPPRAEYGMSLLGPTEFDFCGRAFRRRDYEVVNERGQKLQCSHWEPVEYPQPEEEEGSNNNGNTHTQGEGDGNKDKDNSHQGRLPCIVYMHGNSSARIEALPQLSLCLSLGITVVGFDFAGSGRSDGEFVSLGYYEKDDLKAVVADLRQSGRVSSIAVWGRSMGAVTALMHGERDPSLAAMILDSPFSDLHQLADEMVEKGKEHGMNVPRLVTRLAIRMIKSSVQSKAGFSISHLCPIQTAPRCFMPAIFIAGRDDDFISPAHSQRIHDVYGGDKNLIVVEGDHNSMRPRFMFDSVSIFLQQTLPLNEEFVLPGASKWIGFPPWSHLHMEGAAVYCDDDDDGEDEDGRGRSFHYWQEEFVFDELGHPPLPMLRGGGGGGGGLMREDGVILSRTNSLEQLNVGMTQARQEEIQNAVTNLLGGARGGGSGRREHSQAGAGRRQQPSAVMPSEGEWSCAACTLVNDGRHDICDACGSFRPGRNHNSSSSSSQRISGGAAASSSSSASSSTILSPPPLHPQPPSPPAEPREGEGKEESSDVDAKAAPTDEEHDR